MTVGELRKLIADDDAGAEVTWGDKRMLADFLRYTTKGKTMPDDGRSNGERLAADLAGKALYDRATRDYKAAAHAMQSGVATEMHTYGFGIGDHQRDYKDLRTGINSAMVDSAALARLLIEKGLFTREEYERTITAEMNREVERYEERLTKKLGRTVKLG